MNIHLEVRSGEIVGIAGVSGNGQQELLKAISGEEPTHDRKAVQVCGVLAGRLGAGRRRGLGMCFVPEERLGRGAVPKLTLTENVILTAHRKGMLIKGMIRFRTARKFAEDCIARFDVRCGGADAEAKSLSGGNLQKFIVGPGDHAGPQAAGAGPAHLGRGRGRRLLHPPLAPGHARQGHGHPGDLRGTGRAVRDLRSPGGVIAKGTLSPAKVTSETGVEEIGIWMSGMWPDSKVVEEASHVA